jgi:hypothetical protein
MEEEYKEDIAGCLGRAVIVLLIVGVVFFGLLVGMCGLKLH